MTAPPRPTVGVIGWPIAHSRSPLIHNHWFAVHGLAGRYDRLPVPPDAIEGFLADFKASGLVGANVTIPYKEIAYRAVAARDAVAERLKAVNCLWLEDGRLMGANTDVEGFVANLDQTLPGWDATGGTAFVLGAGGAARAVVDGLVHRGFEVRLANRTRARAETLAALYPGAVTVHGFEDAQEAADGATVVVNTTSLGMKGEGEIPLRLDRLASDSIVADIVYVPLETPFLAAARAAGLRIVDGLGMLLHQAVPSFERWTGVRPPVTPVLRALVEADLVP